MQPRQSQYLPIMDTALTVSVSGLVTSPNSVSWYRANRSMSRELITRNNNNMCRRCRGIPPESKFHRIPFFSEVLARNPRRIPGSFESPELKSNSVYYLMSPLIPTTKAALNRNFHSYYLYRGLPPSPQPRTTGRNKTTICRLVMAPRGRRIWSYSSLVKDLSSRRQI